MPTIRSQIPYSATLYQWLQLSGISLDKLTQQGRRYDRAYLAWETVRQVRNPFFNTGTGFEGYFVGICQSPEEMLDHLLAIGHEMLESNERMYRHDFLFKAKLMKTLYRELVDPHAIEVWSALLGATLGRLRCNVYYNDPTYRFQNETYWTVNRLPPIKYRLSDHHIEQEYLIPRFESSFTSKPLFSLNILKPSDYDAGFAVSTIGCFGHPLLRAYLRDVQ